MTENLDIAEVEPPRPDPSEIRGVDDHLNPVWLAALRAMLHGEDTSGLPAELVGAAPRAPTWAT